MLNDQPTPTKNKYPSMWDLSMDYARNVIGICNELLYEAMEERKQLGITRYGVSLQPFNNRNARVDTLQELLDAYVYAFQYFYEKLEKKEVIYIDPEKYLTKILDLILEMLTQE